MNFLAETCLLTHGLRSVTEEAMERAWPFGDEKLLTWVDEGRIVVGSMAEYLPFRARHEDVTRIDCYTLQEALDNKLSGALTASGTMAACKLMGAELAVTCGMGGIGDIQGEELCPDLPALAELPVALISTSPKDMLDIPATLGWLREHGVLVTGPACTGYVFKSAYVRTEAPAESFSSARAIADRLKKGGLLMLRPIDEGLRIADMSILDKAVLAAKTAETEGKAFHPAANAEIDRLTDGRSSEIQLESFIDNIRFAKGITEES
ncbi:MAG: pseudouridine-5'-phosphate glycosidase [Oscillospiraceae bacterium]|nr:pseudouridine-5'-phosphate glycosidase [Oscillospiraceae bacterium]